MQLKPSTLLKGLATYVPGALKYFCSSTGGTVSARYCYSVWMRHLIKAHEAGLNTRLGKIAELGPGDSLGIGLCAVLCGVEEYYALDTKAHASSERNKIILEELIQMLKRREPIPGESEFPSISPVLKDYSFPHHILTDEVLAGSLHPDRLAAIQTIVNGNQPVGGSIHIAYVAPWQDIPPQASGGVLDMVFSQAVMEHIDGVDSTYASLYEWLHPKGFMSHTIDYKSHGYTRDWNGHWTVSEPVWKMVKGNRPYLISRLPHSAHIEAIKKAGFEIVAEMRRTDSPLERNRLAHRFQTLTDDDLVTSGSFIQAVKP